jgi:tetratricopeptide (TPR) repeat protein
MNEPLSNRQVSRLRRRAEELEEEGKSLEALICQQKAVALAPDDPKTREDLAQMYLERSRFDEAITECKALLRLAPKSLFARDILSIAYLQKGDTDKALVVNDELIRLSPNDARNHYKRGILCQQRGDWQGAMQSLTIAYRIAPVDSIEEGEAQEAIDTLDRHQVKQLVLLMSEDRALRIKIARDPEVAVTERGYSLSSIALAFVEQVATGAVQSQVLIGKENEYLPAQSRFRHYN